MPRQTLFSPPSRYLLRSVSHFVRCIQEEKRPGRVGRRSKGIDSQKTCAAQPFTPIRQLVMVAAFHARLMVIDDQHASGTSERPKLG